MSGKDFELICSKIDEEREFLNNVSQDIWKMPELMFKEVHAHAILTSALTKYGFNVQKHYFMTTAFRGEYCSKAAGGPTIAFLLEYDALPEIGHACGHNLIAEAGLAAALGLKAAMEADSKLAGKIVVLGTPAEEGGGGKIRLIELGAFDEVDIALMVHPARRSSAFPPILSVIRCFIEFKGKEAHASAYPWEGRNALDAAVACYNNISLLRQQMKPSCRIHGIITKGGVAANIIPGETRMEYMIRAPTERELQNLKSRVRACIENAAFATGCEANIRFEEENNYKSLITNKTLGSLFQKYADRLGMDFTTDGKHESVAGSTDMGNVSHVVPSIHPFYNIHTKSGNHTKGFTAASGSEIAQEPTLIAAKAMALTALDVMKKPEILEEIRNQFQSDVAEDKKSE